MLRKISGGLVALTMIVAASLICSATPALAQTAFNDDAPTNLGTVRTTAFSALITVTAPYAVTSISTPNLVNAANNQKFVIIDSSTNTVLYVSSPKAFARDSAATYKTSDPFPAVTLQPGKYYYIGAIVDRNTYYPYRGTAIPVTQGVVTNGAGAGGASSGNITNYANPSAGAAGGVQVPIRLVGSPVSLPTPVPTMTEWAMILMGVMLAGVAALTIQRRRTLA